MILKGETKPHIYTKIIWFIIVFMAFIIQLKSGGGPGSYMLGITSLLHFVTLVLSFKYGTKDITKFDTVLLILALFSIIVYVGIENQLYALLLIIFINIMAYISTIRKTYNAPFSENLAVWNIGTFKHFISIFALLQYSIYTLAYPLVIIFTNLLFIIMMIYRMKNI